MTANILWLSAMSVRPPRVRTHSFSPFVCHIYFLGFRVVIGLRLVAQPHPSQPASCDFCSSDQRFACTFLQIPPHDGHPWCSAMTFPLLGQSRDFHPLECAHAGRTKNGHVNRKGSTCPYMVLIRSSSAVPHPSSSSHRSWNHRPVQGRNRPVGCILPHRGRPAHIIKTASPDSKGKGCRLGNH